MFSGISPLCIGLKRILLEKIPLKGGCFPTSPEERVLQLQLAVPHLRSENEANEIAHCYETLIYRYIRSTHKYNVVSDNCTKLHFI